ncbi:MAG TPA: tetratricopeptide repeat protein, partial [Actinomycetota bacterium]
ERAIFQDLAANLDAASTSMDSARVEMLAEDFLAAERELQSDYQELSRLEEKYILSTVAGLLGHVLYLQDRCEEADKFTHIAEAASSPNDVESESLWRRARAKVYARWGRHAEAEALARTAYELITTTDSPVLQGNTLLDLGEVLRMAGKRTVAVPLVEEAIRLFEQKGDVVTAARARRDLKTLVDGEESARFGSTGS